MCLSFRIARLETYPKEEPDGRGVRHEGNEKGGGAPWAPPPGGRLAAACDAASD